RTLFTYTTLFRSRLCNDIYPKKPSFVIKKNRLSCCGVISTEPKKEIKGFSLILLREWKCRLSKTFSTSKLPEIIVKYTARTSTRLLLPNRLKRLAHACRHLDFLKFTGATSLPLMP